MKKFYFYRSLIVGTILFAIPAASFALLVDESINVGNRIDSNATSTTNFNVNTNLNSTSSTGRSFDDNDAENNTNTNDVRIQTNSSGVEVLLPTQVNTEEDLDIYQKNTMVLNNNVTAIETEIENGVVVEYKHPGKLFGIIDVVVDSKTRVESGQDGKIKTQTTFPWWSAMVRGIGDIRSQVDSTIQSQFANMMTNGTTEAVLKAKLIDTIISAHATARFDQNAEARRDDVSTTSTEYSEPGEDAQ